MHRNVTIKNAVTGDAPQIVSIWEKSRLVRPWNDPFKDVELALTSQSSVLLVAENERNIVGTVMAGWDGHRGWIYYLAVDPEWQKQGIGKNLFQKAYDWLADKGAPKVQILIRADNDEAVSFYESLGFEKSTSLLMGKPII